ncbi:hypothetical protein CTAYLR_007560 [Chrysophaeum taylorii]|uniref:Uncharacterized protein n=1 Tax=Chrysophaeum taylorii TaxID=2483200 RepID=A0AAD7U6R9_9STRA|nr:hypothetical protein CTAYLR_007560 [Chrysophaeum taylorii]
MFESVGLQKALSFMFMAVVGRLVKKRFTAEHVAGIQRLILDVMLPCMIFKSLCSIQVSAGLLKWPALGVAFAAWQLGTAFVFCRLSLARGTARRTAILQLATAAPGLSAMVFVKEFVGEEAAGMAALFDLPTKVYLIFGLPRLLALAGDGENGEVSQAKKKKQSALLDPLNVAIAAGLAMAATRTKFAALSFVGRGVTALADAQTPVLFVLIGMKLKVSGATPAVCLALLAVRQAANYAFFLLASAIAGGDLALLLACQAAVSVIGWSQMHKIKEAGVKGYDTAFAFDVVGFSMPLAMGLQTMACLQDPKAAVATMAPYGAPALLGLGATALVALQPSLRESRAWAEHPRAD